MNQQLAQQQIAAILADLERATGQLVEEIGIRSIEITRIQDVVPQWQREVEIRLKPVPGSHWGDGR